MYYVPSMSAAAPTSGNFEATVTMSGAAAQLTMCLMEWGGYLPAFPLLDPASVNFISSSMVNPAITSWVQSPSIGQLIITGVKTSGSVSANSGWTEVQQNQSAAIGVYYQITGSGTPSGSITLKPTNVGSGATSLCVSAVFGCPSLGGTVSGNSNVSGKLTTEHPLSGTASKPKGRVSGAVSVTRGLTGSIVGDATVNGLLVCQSALSGQIAGQSSVIGTPKARYSLAGPVTGAANLTGNLFVPLPFVENAQFKALALMPQITIYVNGVAYTINSPGVTDLNPTPGSLQEAVQRVFNVLLVQLGSQILALNYGLDNSWLDKPFNIKAQAGVNAVVQAIQQWVPYVGVKTCNIVPVNNGVFNTFALNVTLTFTPPNQANSAVFGPPGGTLVTTTDIVNGIPAVVQETLTI
jgi:hypothetical protein